MLNKHAPSLFSLVPSRVRCRCKIQELFHINLLYCFHAASFPAVAWEHADGFDQQCLVALLCLLCCRAAERSLWTEAVCMSMAWASGHAENHEISADARWCTLLHPRRAVRCLRDVKRCGTHGLAGLIQRVLVTFAEAETCSEMTSLVIGMRSDHFLLIPVFHKSLKINREDRIGNRCISYPYKLVRRGSGGVEETAGCGR